MKERIQIHESICEGEECQNQHMDADRNILNLWMYLRLIKMLIYVTLIFHMCLFKIALMNATLNNNVIMCGNNTIHLLNI